MPPESEEREQARDSARRVGLCLTCAHSRRVPTPRGTYWLCGLAASDPRFEKYPRLPVLSCSGCEPGASGDSVREGPTSPGGS